MEHIEIIMHWLGEAGSYIYPINFILGIAIIFFERRNPSTVWAWLLLMYFIPVLGFIFYLFLGQDLRRKKMFRMKEIEDKVHYMALTQEKKLMNRKTVFNHKELESYKDMIAFHLASNDALYTDDNDIEIFTSGVDKFDNLKQNLLAAKKFIHMEYYIIRNDYLATELLEILCQKAKEGVEVRLLYDGMGCLGVPRKIFSNLHKAGGKVGEFFPPKVPYINLRMNFRNHRKICIIDGDIGFIGGFNIGREYLGDGKLGNWRDTHLKIEGSAVDSLQLRFALDWNFATKENLLKDITYFIDHKDHGDTGIQIVASGPDSKWQNVKNGYFKMFNEANKNIYIQTPYLILDDSMIQALKVAALSGVDVRIMIPCKPDHMFVYWASYSYVGELLEAGVKCYTYNDGFIHCKTVCIDGMAASVGTANMDIRSFKLNFEVNAFIYDIETTKRLEAYFIEDLKCCTEITKEVYSKRTYKIRFKESVSRLLSPIL